MFFLTDMVQSPPLPYPFRNFVTQKSLHQAFFQVTQLHQLCFVKIQRACGCLKHINNPLLLWNRREDEWDFGNHAPICTRHLCARCNTRGGDELIGLNKFSQVRAAALLDICLEHPYFGRTDAIEFTIVGLAQIRTKFSVEYISPLEDCFRTPLFLRIDHSYKASVALGDVFKFNAWKILPGTSWVKSSL